MASHFGFPPTRFLISTNWISNDWKSNNMEFVKTICLFRQHGQKVSKVNVLVLKKNKRFLYTLRVTHVMGPK
jgi:hypothetical protein